MLRISYENQLWIEGFRSHYGRSPRILHIGNIANNAYNNAKILNEIGLDCDVLCYDYYHIMGCPEWEDADIPFSPRDDFHPDWTRIPLGNYQRPRWYAQGPILECIEYLCHRRSLSSDADRLWLRLLISSRVAPPKTLDQWLYYLSRQTLSFRRRFQSAKKFAIHQILSRQTLSFRRRLKAGVGRIKFFFNTFSHSVKTNNITADERYDYLIEKFAKEFPLRKDLLEREDVIAYGTYFHLWKKLFTFYDIVIGYSTDPFYPLLCGTPYFAFEHGTLRTIPYCADGQGRRTSIAYRCALHCFVTNFDCAESANQLAPSRFTLINHPYDEDHGLNISGSEELRQELLKTLDCDFLFFHPTRQDWVEGTGYADKKNDEFLYAFAALRKRGTRVGLVICSWGGNVEQSRKLLLKLGLSRHVRWIAPLAITPFERMCRACDVLADQFKLGSFGGVVFKAMAVGTPVITYLNENLITRQYPEVPPVINCKTTKEIEKAIEEIIQEPDRLKRLSQQSRDWICCYHSKWETINKQLNQFRLQMPLPSF